MSRWLPILLITALAGALPRASASAGDLLNETFDDGLGALVATGEVERFDGVLTLPADGAVTTKHAVDGDLAVSIQFAGALESGGVQVDLGNGSVSVKIQSIGGLNTVSAFTPSDSGESTSGRGSPPGKVEIRNRSHVIEVALDGRVAFSHFFKAPVAGGTLAVSALGADQRLDSIQVERLGWYDGIRVDRLDEVRMEEARRLDPQRFRLLDPPPGIIDPVFRVTWVEEDGVTEVDPVVVRYAGIRPLEDDNIPALTQALALAGIRPYLQVRAWDGEGPDDGLPLTVSGDGVLRVTKGPGLIEAATLTWMGEVWPTATAWDVTNDRLLDRCVPAGPARRDLYTHIPDDCDEVRITVAGPGTLTVEKVIRIQRS